MVVARPARPRATLAGTMHVAIVANPRSGRGAAGDAAEGLRVRLSRAGIASRAVSLDAAAAEWSASTIRARAVVAVGGDGTVRSVAGRLAGSALPLAILPTGTENLAARALGHPAAVDRLVQDLASPRARPVDLGVVRRAGHADHPFIVMASAGFDAAVVAALDAVRHGPISHASYLAPILRTARSWRPPRIAATPAGGAVVVGTGQLVVANAAAYALRLDPCRGANPADGLLDAVLLPASGAWALVRWAVRLRCSADPGRGAVRARSASWAIELDRPVPLQADGDLVPGRPAAAFEVACLPGALRVLDRG